MSATRRFFRPTWAEVHLGALQENLRRFRRRMPARTQILFVVKGNAYGHGAELCAGALARAGCRNFGVASVEEAAEIRRLVARAYGPLIVGQVWRMIEAGPSPFRARALKKEQVDGAA